MRMFVALTLPPPVRDDLAAYLKPRRTNSAGLRWTAPEHWHVTLAFMPQVAEDDLDDLVKRLRRAVRRRPTLTLNVSGLGAFPNPARARVLYAAVHSADPGELRLLTMAARAAANKAGVETGRGGFHPHVTLARLSRPATAAWLNGLDPYTGPSWQAEEIALIRSHLGEGPQRRHRYELVKSLSLSRTMRVPGDG
ncbi:MAG: RNA 2',3'-cyclic phosphodiesterase [Streptosporangiales bacterium]|nr:RNA 2',3'-cyclic phosphodiesterase [Streptosporangiales bacterium]